MGEGRGLEWSGREMDGEGKADQSSVTSHSDRLVLKGGVASERRRRGGEAL